MGALFFKENGADNYQQINLVRKNAGELLWGAGAGYTSLINQQRTVEVTLANLAGKVKLTFSPSSKDITINSMTGVTFYKWWEGKIYPV